MKACDCCTAPAPLQVAGWYLRPHNTCLIPLDTISSVISGTGMLVSRLRAGARVDEQLTHGLARVRRMSTTQFKGGAADSRSGNAVTHCATVRLLGPVEIAKVANAKARAKLNRTPCRTTRYRLMPSDEQAHATDSCMGRVWLAEHRWRADT